MSFPVSGEFDLELTRYYNSFNEKKTGFGYGWSAVNMFIAFFAFIALELDKRRREWVVV